jgi:hypothetical protein
VDALQRSEGLDRLGDELAESGRRILRDHGLRAVA